MGTDVFADFVLLGKVVDPYTLEFVMESLVFDVDKFSPLLSVNMTFADS